MSIDPTSFALGAVFSFAIGALALIGWAMVLVARDRKRLRREALDNACNELERGEQ